jgi:hypothetical protein
MCISLFMQVCSMCVCIYVSACIVGCDFMHVHTCIYVCMHVCICAFVLYVYVCIHVCMSLGMYLHLHTHVRCFNCFLTAVGHFIIPTYIHTHKYTHRHTPKHYLARGRHAPSYTSTHSLTRIYPHSHSSLFQTSSP